MTSTAQAPTSLRLPKSERLCSRTAVERLFAPRSKALRRMAYPLRAVWLPRADAGAEADAEAGLWGGHRFLVMVPKKRLRRAVDRVKMRRRIREAFRLGRHNIPQGLPPLDLAVVYVASELMPYADVERSMTKILSHLAAEPKKAETC